MEENYIYLQFYWIKMLKVDSFCLVMQLIFIWVRIFIEMSLHFIAAGTLNIHIESRMNECTATRHIRCVHSSARICLIAIVSACIVIAAAAVVANMTAIQFNLIWFVQISPLPLSSLALNMRHAAATSKSLTQSSRQDKTRQDEIQQFIVIASCVYFN